MRIESNLPSEAYYFLFKKHENQSHRDHENETTMVPGVTSPNDKT
jgi:hypothetical protein